MLVIEKTTEFDLKGRSAVAVGKFDGVHLGHQKLLNKIIEQKKNGCLAAVFTFGTSAASFFGGEEKELTTAKEKRAVFEKMGIDVLIEFPLNERTAATEPVDFILRYLAGQMHAVYICAGTDVSFGKEGKGDDKLLRRYAGKCGYQVEMLDKIRAGGEEVSSTRIREFVKGGEMERAAAMLGSAYYLEGTVEHGRRLGRTIGMPTANVIPPPEKLLPPNGVYYSRVHCMGKEYRSITNIGCKPTVSDENVMGAESYLYDFTGDIYGQDIKVELLSFRRPEMKFESVEALKKQMRADIEAGIKGNG